MHSCYTYKNLSGVPMLGVNLTPDLTLIARVFTFGFGQAVDFVADIYQRK